MRFGLKEKNIIAMNNIFNHFKNIEEVILYGSRAKGNYKDSSDIDLTLVGSNIDLSVLTKILNELDDLLLPHSIDLSIRKNIQNSDLQKHIDTYGVTFYKQKSDTKQLNNNSKNNNTK